MSTSWTISSKPQCKLQTYGHSETIPHSPTFLSDTTIFLLPYPALPRPSFSHRAVAQGYSAFVRMLIQDGKAKVNTRDSVANTPLHLACEEGHGDTAVLLIEHGADPDILNKDGQTPIDLCATKQVRSYIERAIEQSGWTGWVDQKLGHSQLYYTCRR